MIRRKVGLALFWCLLTVVLRPAQCGAQQTGETRPVSTAQGKDESGTALPLTDEDTNTGTDMSADQPSVSNYENSIGIKFVKHLASDQVTIWTSPAHLRFSDVDWILPLGAATGLLIATDSDVSRHLSNSPSRLKHSSDFSNAGLGALVAAGGGMYLWGHFTHEEHKRETGLLAGEAAIDVLAVTYATKYAFGRERPLEDNYRGKFFSGGGSFPSEHSATAWAIAGIIAHEYPGPISTALSYGLATAISASRVTAKQHFPSDVVIGAAIGWFTAQEVYRHHHDFDLGGRDWPTYREATDEGPGRRSSSVGSPYVELDSWIYPAIERLAAMGYIRADYLGIRPWTRLECAELVGEAGDQIRAQEPVSGAANEIYESLLREFQSDLADAGEGGAARATVESLYSSVTGIHGRPLADSDHFGQTIFDNFGRPYQEGISTYNGFSAYATIGRFAAYVRGEYQAAPSAPAYSLAVRNAIATMDANPMQAATPIASTGQFHLLDAYFTADYAGWDFSFGKQSLWWGPGREDALILSDNAEPMYMFRMTPEKAFEVPLLSRFLGPFKTDFFFGKLSGNEFPARPAIHGENIRFKPTRNLEIGFTRLVQLGGVGRPLTAGAIWNSYVSVKSSVNYRASRNPGKRTSGFDFAYRVPFVHSGLMVYGESLAPDDVTPLAAPPRAAWNSGIYMPRFAGISRLDLRVEGGYTDPVTPRSNDGEYVYWDLFYHDLSTNKKNLIGSWLGREGKGVRAISAYSFSARNNIQFAYRQAKVSKDFVPRGETINDGSLTVNWWPSRFISLHASVQYEKWTAPILAPGPQTNWTSSFEIAFWPREWHADFSHSANAVESVAERIFDGK